MKYNEMKQDASCVFATGLKYAHGMLHLSLLLRISM